MTKLHVNVVGIILLLLVGLLALSACDCPAKTTETADTKAGAPITELKPALEAAESGVCPCTGETACEEDKNGKCDDPACEKIDCPNKKTNAPKKVQIVKPDKVMVTYFHGDFRCPTCTKLEQLGQSAIETGFADEVKKGTVEWRVVNTDKNENKHFTTDYQLYTKSIIVSSMKDGKEIKWKNLEKIWEHVHAPDTYLAYVKKHVRAALDAK